METKEQVRVCVYCGEPVKQIGAGDETLDWCQSCQLIEGGTKLVDEDELDP